MKQIDKIEQDAIKGLKATLWFMAGLVITFVGFIVLLFQQLVGNIIWAIGTALILFTIIRNFASKSGFGIANAIIKIIIILFSIFFMIIANIIMNTT